jgi:hypothetical protein
VGLRILGFLAVLATLGASGYVFVEKARSGDLNPVTEMNDAVARGELASAQYVLGIVSGQLAQVKVLSGSYAGTLEFDRYPLVTLVRADEHSYCLEFAKTHTFMLEGPGGLVREGRC